MSAKDEASLLMVESARLMFPDRGKAQVTSSEWIVLCDLLLATQDAAELGPLAAQLSNRRVRIAALALDEDSDDEDQVA